MNDPKDPALYNQAPDSPWKTIHSQAERIASLETALKFYAKEENHFPDKDGHIKELSKVAKECGTRAREALEKGETK
jgi:hypothetical protein